MTLQQKIDKANNGLNTHKRRVVSVSSCHIGNDEGYIIVGRSRLL